MSLMRKTVILAVALLCAAPGVAFTVTPCSAVATRRPAVRETQPVVAVTPVEVALGFAAVTGLVVVGGTATVLAGSAEFQLPMERRRQEEAARLAELQNDAALQNELRLE